MNLGVNNLNKIKNKLPNKLIRESSNKALVIFKCKGNVKSFGEGLFSNGI